MLNAIIIVGGRVFKEGIMDHYRALDLSQVFVKFCDGSEYITHMSNVVIIKK